MAEAVPRSRLVGRVCHGVRCLRTPRKATAAEVRERRQFGTLGTRSVVCDSEPVPVRERVLEQGWVLELVSACEWSDPCRERSPAPP